MNMDILSIYLDHWFLSSQFHSFSHIDTWHILWNLYLIFNFCAIVNDISLDFFDVPIAHYWYVEKQLTF